MATLVEYLRPHSTTSTSEGDETFYPAPGFTFTIDMGGAGPMQMQSIEIRKDGSYEITVNDEELDVDGTPLEELPIEVWFKIPQQ